MKKIIYKVFDWILTNKIVNSTVRCLMIHLFLCWDLRFINIYDYLDKKNSYLQFIYSRVKKNPTKTIIFLLVSTKTEYTYVLRYCLSTLMFWTIFRHLRLLILIINDHWFLPNIAEWTSAVKSQHEVPLLTFSSGWRDTYVFSGS